MMGHGGDEGAKCQGRAEGLKGLDEVQDLKAGDPYTMAELETDRLEVNQANWMALTELRD